MSDDYRKVYEGEHCEVWLHKSVVKEIEGAPADDRARARKILDHLSKHGDTDLNQKQFKFEQRFKVGHVTVGVFAVKAYQLRVMGGWVDGPPRKFICPEAVIKKRNEADRSQLKRVADKVGDYCGG